MTTPIVLFRGKQTRKTDDGGVSITKRVLGPPPSPAPYSLPDLPTNHVPSLTWMCLRLLAESPDEVHHLGVRLFWHGPPPEAPADPRLWATLVQVYENLPAALHTHRVPLSDPHVPLLQRVPSTPLFALLTVLDLPGCPHLADATVSALAGLHSLVAFDASATSLTSYAIKVLAATLLWIDDGPARRGPWPLRILRLRYCTHIDNTVYVHLAAFPLLSAIDLRGTLCTPDPTTPFRPASSPLLFHPAPLATAVTLLSTHAPHLYSSENAYTLLIDSLNHPSKPRPKRRTVALQDSFLVFNNSKSKPWSTGDSEAVLRKTEMMERDLVHEANSAAWHARHPRENFEEADYDRYGFGNPEEDIISGDENVMQSEDDDDDSQDDDEEEDADDDDDSSQDEDDDILLASRAVATEHVAPSTATRSERSHLNAHSEYISLNSEERSSLSETAPPRIASVAPSSILYTLPVASTSTAVAPTPTSHLLVMQPSNTSTVDPGSSTPPITTPREMSQSMGSRHALITSSNYSHPQPPRRPPRPIHNLLRRASRFPPTRMPLNPFAQPSLRSTINRPNVPLPPVERIPAPPEHLPPVPGPSEVHPSSFYYNPMRPPKYEPFKNYSAAEHYRREEERSRPTGRYDAQLTLYRAPPPWSALEAHSAGLLAKARARANARPPPAVAAVDRTKIRIGTIQVDQARIDALRESARRKSAGAQLEAPGAAQGRNPFRRQSYPGSAAGAGKVNQPRVAHVQGERGGKPLKPISEVKVPLLPKASLKPTAAAKNTGLGTRNSVICKEGAIRSSTSFRGIIASSITAKSPPHASRPGDRVAEQSLKRSSTTQGDVPNKKIKVRDAAVPGKPHSKGKAKRPPTSAEPSVKKAFDWGKWAGHKKDKT